MTVEIGAKTGGLVRAICAADLRSVRHDGEASEKSSGPALTAPTVVRSDALDPGQPPVDAERIKQIRQAIEEGRYPIVPTKVADAMIAAGLLLRSGK